MALFFFFCDQFIIIKGRVIEWLFEGYCYTFYQNRLAISRNVCKQNNNIDELCKNVASKYHIIDGENNVSSLE